VDRIDIAGGAGLALIVCGVWGLSGWPWAVILFGGALVGLYTVREVRAIVRS
jgi:hypothetical protein